MGNRKKQKKKKKDKKRDIKLEALQVSANVGAPFGIGILNDLLKKGHGFYRVRRQTKTSQSAKATSISRGLHSRLSNLNLRTERKRQKKGQWEAKGDKNRYQEAAARHGQLNKGRHGRL